MQRASGADRLVGSGRSTQRYRAHREQPALGNRSRELAPDRPRFGYWYLFVMLRREGFAINDKRVYRLYRADGLTVRRRPAAPRGASGLRVCDEANDRWAMDFSDALFNGRK